MKGKTQWKKVSRRGHEGKELTNLRGQVGGDKLVGVVDGRLGWVDGCLKGLAEVGLVVGLLHIGLHT